MESVNECASNCSVIADADGDGVDGIDCGGSDCDDTDPTRYPGASEICDAANVDEDCNAATFGLRDGDGDGFVDASCCNASETGGLMSCGDDCSDFRRDMHPGLAEVCDFLDNDCDGIVDDGATVAGFADLDHDLHGDPTVPISACPSTPGFSVVGDDCNDADPEVHRAQLEICDGKDNNCNGMIDESPAAVTWYADDDDDGFGIDASRTRVSCAPIPGFSLRPSDCDDTRRDRSPAARELCNGEDDDCDGVANFMIRPGNFEDDDGDGYADMVCGGNDCDDSNTNVHPGAPELCDGLDNDCNGVVDGGDAMAQWYLDLDGDGFGDPTMPAITSCDPQPARVSRGGDCDDASAAVHPGVADLCDGTDDDCDGAIDEDSVRFAYYSDVDGDGWGASASAIVFACVPPAGRSLRPGDCEDSRADTYPGAPELCDLVDNDCDGMVDEDAPVSWYPDVDRDGHGVPGGAVVTCSPPPGYAMVSDDCDDANGGNFPGNTETCNGRDDDCDGAADDGAAASCDAYPHTAPTTACTAGACVLACDVNYSDCNGTFVDGCEIDTRRSPTYCGSCINACGPADTCGLVTPSVCDASPVVSLDGGNGFVLAVRATGGVAAWGDAGANGQTALGSDTPVPQGTSLSGIVQVDASNEGHACALTTGGRVLCWGFNLNGQLGDGTSTSRSAPRVVTTLPNAVQISAGGIHTCAVLATGSVMCWGFNTSGQLGDGTFLNRSTPVLVPGITDAVEVYAGYRHTCVRRGTLGAYSVSCWGLNSSGDLGIGTSVGSLNTPQMTIGLPGNLAGFSHGSGHNATYVFTTDGLAYGWGSNTYDVLGLGAASSDPVTVPTQNPALTRVVEISLAADRGCARTRRVGAGFDVYCWGRQSVSMLWIDGTMGGHVFARGSVPVPRLAGGTSAISDAIAIHVGLERWCAARASGGVVCMGNDANGALGDGVVIANQLTPVPVVGLP